MDLRADECPYCLEEVLVSTITRDGKPIEVALQPEEIEGIDQDGHQWRGHERHWKYCTARPTTGSASAAPPDEPPDEPDKVLNE
jgi:hypothetical protein